MILISLLITYINTVIWTWPGIYIKENGSKIIFSKENGSMIKLTWHQSIGKRTFFFGRKISFFYFQVKDHEDVVWELWRRQDEADRSLIASLRAAVGLPTQEDNLRDMFGILFYLFHLFAIEKLLYWWLWNHHRTSSCGGGSRNGAIGGGFRFWQDVNWWR